MTQALERELAEAREALAAIRAEYDAFAYIVSHDLRSVFRQVEGFSKIVVENNADTLDDKTRRHFELILNGSEKGKNILDALLSYSRLNTSGIRIEPIDCNAIVDDILSALASPIDSKKAVIQCDKLPTINADSRLLRSVFESLIKNALTYHAPSSAPEISITAMEHDDVWGFCVKDCGIGIKDNQHDKVFQVLRRGTLKGYESFEPNMGMGLAVAQKIVRRHGGDIHFETEFGVGSTFTFTLSKNLQPDNASADK